jgi:hypothetical protein
MTATGRKKLDELYHPVVDRSEFYGMSDINKPPVLFTPAEDIDKVKFIHFAEETNDVQHVFPSHLVVIDGIARFLWT